MTSQNEHSDSSGMEWEGVVVRGDAENLYDKTRAFHDGVVLEAKWVGRDSINEDRYLVFGGYGDLFVRVESQFADVPAIDMLFRGVREFSYSCEKDYELLVDFVGDEINARFLGWEIRCAELKYRQRDAIFGGQ